MSGLDPSKNYSRSHMFKVYRTQLRYIGVPMFLGCSSVDFLVMPEHAKTWLIARILISAYVWITFALMAKFSWARKQIHTFVFAVICLISLFCNLTVYDSGGVGSPYLTGICVASTAFILMFRLGRIGSLLSQLIISGPVIVTMFYLARPDQMTAAAVTSIFFLCMAGLATMGSISGEQLTKVWSQAYRVAKTEVERHRRSEFLKKHFPPSILQEIESGRFSLQRRTEIPMAVVGFADIISSTKIANIVGLQTDWELKERFLASATKSATDCGMVVLNQMGDGFLLWANYFDNESWKKNLLKFHQQVTDDLNEILASLKHEIGSIESGVRFGISQGPVLVGWIGNDQSYFTAVGPDVNLAARLCSMASNNDIVVSSRVWWELKSVAKNYTFSEVIYKDLKGFDCEIPAVHIQSEHVEKIKAA